MDLDSDLVINQCIVNLNESLNNFTKQVYEDLSVVVDDLNRCQANLIILEKKIEASLDN